jgi:hypothetical protein
MVNGVSLGMSVKLCCVVTISPLHIWSINKQLERRRLVVSRQKAFVVTIEHSGDALSMELGVTSELEFAV